MEKLVKLFLLIVGIVGPAVAYFQRDTLWLGVGVVCLILLFVLLVDD